MKLRLLLNKERADTPLLQHRGMHYGRLGHNYGAGASWPGSGHLQSFFSTQSTKHVTTFFGSCRMHIPAQAQFLEQMQVPPGTSSVLSRQSLGGAGIAEAIPTNRMASIMQMATILVCAVEAIATLCYSCEPNMC